MTLVGVWAAYVSFSRPADRLTITSKDFALHYPSGRVYRLDWNDRATQFEIYYGNQTPSTKVWLERRYGGMMSGGQVSPTWFSPITLLTRDAEAALKRDARSHGFSIVDTTNYWGNRTVYFYGPDVRRRRRDTNKRGNSISFNAEGRIQCDQDLCIGKIL
jgi:hypothetical protein